MVRDNNGLVNFNNSNLGECIIFDSNLSSTSTAGLVKDSSSKSDVNISYAISGEKAYAELTSQYENELLSIILNDSFEYGVASQSEEYFQEIVNDENFSYVKEAAMQLYLDRFSDANTLIGLMVMMSSIPYEKASPQGQIMALGLLQYDDVSVRDRAIQAFEKWNSKKGIDVLRKIHCDRKWQQQYVEKVIAYLERDGIE